MLTRQELEEREEKLLAPYAAKSKRTKGRIHPEEEHPFRSVYQRDRDRIIHSNAFRKLEYKTQVFLNHEGDYYRTRLTHTLEVAQIAVSIARTLRLNEDLTEAIALAHDIGHTPFGHAGEEVLRELMKDFGGFEHNQQGLRVVDLLEERYPNFKGLNLTYETREGIAKHKSFFDQKDMRNKEFEHYQPSLEAQVVDLADEIAYDSHDLDDGITAGLINEEQLLDVEIWKEVYKPLSRKGLSREMLKYQAVRSLINLSTIDLIKESEKRLESIGSLEEVRKSKHRLISFSKEMSEKRKELKNFLSKNLYSHYRVMRMMIKAQRFIKQLFLIYSEKPQQLPLSCQEKIGEQGLERTICDYIAGMTDRFVLEEYKKLFDPYEKV
ncbi:MAG: deoxyguanosinetriphosphate triphosphohydrolase [Candidatus Omnitrophota bacterium]|nr:MAG: deoxyguanosinetriphosphate triphosphohydrolase [Candidatus Omnitrophota bacterium]